MPSVITFWQLPEEECRLVDYLDRSGDGIVAWPNEYVADVSQVLRSTPRELIATHECQSMLFCPERFCIGTSTRSAEIQGSTRFIGRRQEDDPVLGYARGIVKPNNELTLSNLFGYWERLSADEDRIERKDQEFVAWGRRVLQWARRHASCRQLLNGYEYFCTRAAKAAFDQNELKPAS